MLKAEDLNKAKLIEVVTNAGLEVHDEGDDNKIYVKSDDFGVWVSFDENLKRIQLSTYYQCKNGAPLEELGNFSELCNQHFPVVQFF